MNKEVLPGSVRKPRGGGLKYGPSLCLRSVLLTTEKRNSCPVSIYMGADLGPFSRQRRRGRPRSRMLTGFLPGKVCFFSTSGFFRRREASVLGRQILEWGILKITWRQERILRRDTRTKSARLGNNGDYALVRQFPWMCRWILAPPTRTSALCHPLPGSGETRFCWWYSLGNPFIHLVYLCSLQSERKIQPVNINHKNKMNSK